MYLSIPLGYFESSYYALIFLLWSNTLVVLCIYILVLVLGVAVKYTAVSQNVDICKGQRPARKELWDSCILHCVPFTDMKETKPAKHESK